MVARSNKCNKQWRSDPQREDTGHLPPWNTTAGPCSAVTNSRPTLFQSGFIRCLLPRKLVVIPLDFLKLSCIIWQEIPLIHKPQLCEIADLSKSETYNSTEQQMQKEPYYKIVTKHSIGLGIVKKINMLFTRYFPARHAIPLVYNQRVTGTHLVQPAHVTQWHGSIHYQLPCVRR